MQKADYLIAGGGIAGMTLALALRWQGASAVVADHPDPASSSRVAAGIIHPVTGRRIVKSWRADTLIPFAAGFYRSLEKQTGQSFFFETPVVEVYGSPKQRNDWAARSAEPGYGTYIGEEWPPHSLNGIVRMPYGGIHVRACRIDPVKFIDAAASVLHPVIRQRIEPDAIVEKETIHWNGMEFGKVIYCTGHHIAAHPYFRTLPFLPAHGELLTIRCDGLPADQIYSKGMFILPAGRGLFKVGATYAWNATEPKPSTEGLHKIKSFLDDLLVAPYSIVAHEAGIRPAIEGRRPVMGLLPAKPGVGIFNGLGAKGAMLAPFFADHLASHLVHRTPLDPEVDVRRFL